MATTTKAAAAERGPGTAAPAATEGAELYLRMFRTMALHRAVEDRMVSMYRQGELLGSLYTGHWHEAIAVGTAAALRPDDFLAPLHRDLGAHLWRGMEPWQVMAMPVSYGVCAGRGGCQATLSK
jgi:TPP-dependent pyruvate/acetoin dehydrogenase alpha subunit